MNSDIDLITTRLLREGFIVRKSPERVEAKIRYRHKGALALVTHHSNSPKLYRVIFDKPQRAITPGQSVVFYKREDLLGGGIIRT